jgi:Predicted periplasmic lipoprotein (DUF2279)
LSARSRLRRWSRLLVVLLAPSLLVIVAPRPLAAQTLVSGDLQPRYRLLDPADDGYWGALSFGLGDGPYAPIADVSPYLPSRDEKQPRKLLGALVIGLELGVTAGKGLIGHQAKPFHVTREGFFGPNTLDGGADKAAHFSDYFVISKEFAYIFGKLGFSESSALLLGLGTAMVGGALNEVGDGFSQPGFSYEDIVMDWLGAGTATLLLATRMDDLLGVRTSHLDGYPHDVFSADLKLSGLARRFNLNIGPFRYLLLSVTYGTKGYPDGPLAERQRQVGVEIGLNLEQILTDLGVTRDTWWGYVLHFAGDNARWPFTAVGFRFDLNHSKWHGPNGGNFP